MLVWLELPISGDPPALASQSAGIADVSYHARPQLSNKRTILYPYDAVEIRIPLPPPLTAALFFCSAMLK